MCGIQCDVYHTNILLWNRNFLPSLCMLQHLLYTSLSMFYPVSCNLICGITSITTYVSLNTHRCYKHLFLMLGRYVHMMGICWFHCGGMHIFTVHSWKHHTQHTSLYILHTKPQSEIRVLSSEGTCTSLYSIILKARLLMRTCNLERFHENGALRSVSLY
jgi:hypothetical protein